MNTTELKAKDLELVVIVKSIGHLSTNAHKIKTAVMAALQKYDPANYTEETVDQAKKDKALINKAAKALNDKRIEIEREFIAPLNDFKATISETVNAMRECSAQIDTVVKSVEEKAKAEKMDRIRTLWSESEFAAMVPVEKVFDARWLNKSVSFKTIAEDMAEITKKITADLAAIRAMNPADADIVAKRYMDRLDMHDAIAYSAELVDMRKRVEAKQDKPAEPAQTTAPTPPAQEMERPMPTFDSGDTEPAETYILKVTGPRSKMHSLAAYMKANGITFRLLNE